MLERLCLPGAVGVRMAAMRAVDVSFLVPPVVEMLLRSVRGIALHGKAFGASVAGKSQVPLAVFHRNSLHSETPVVDAEDDVSEAAASGSHSENDGRNDVALEQRGCLGYEADEEQGGEHAMHRAKHTPIPSGRHTPILHSLNNWMNRLMGAPGLGHPSPQQAGKAPNPCGRQSLPPPNGPNRLFHGAVHESPRPLA
jgi:hypothetical protein